MTYAPRSIASGALAGAVATLPMSALMYASKQLGWMGEYPPVVIVDALLDALGVERDGATDEAMATLAHVGFGAAAGAIFGLLGGRTPARIPTWVEGMAYGVAVYAGSYAGWVPGLDILPPPDHDRPGRQPSMLAAHLVYGAVLGALVTARPALPRPSDALTTRAARPAAHR